MTLQIDRASREPTMPSPPRPNPPVASSDPVLIVGGAETPDLIGVDAAMAPLVELCLSPLAETPFRIGLIGPLGSGKTFALKRLAAAISVAASQPPDSYAPRHSRIVIANFDAAGLGSDRAVGFDPASALASAVFVALENGRDGLTYTALADEAAHGAADPLRAAIAAAERHDETSKRLDAERTARADLESKRARLSDVILYETPGSRVDAMIRANRATIEARLGRFGFGEGNATANYRDLLRDLAATNPTARIGLLFRAIWAYRGQLTLIVTAIVALAFAYGLARLRGAAADGSLAAFSDSLTSAAGFITANAGWIGHAITVLAWLAALAAFYDLWRAVGFSALLYRGLRLLSQEIVDRKRELDASVARADRRLATLSAEADATGRRAENLARRAGGARHVARPPGPAFLRALETPAKTSRDFFAELGRLMSRPASPETPTPSRLILAIDNLEALAPADASRLIDATQALIGPGAVALIACDPSALAPGAGPAFARSRFDVTFNLAALGGGDAERLAARVMGGAAAPGASPTLGVRLVEPLSAAEAALLAALAPLTEGTPGAIRGLYNAYRLARVADAPRPLIALMLAALSSPNRDYARSLANALALPGETVEEPVETPKLVAAIQAARGAHGAPLSKAGAAAAWNVARRWSPSQV